MIVFDADALVLGCDVLCGHGADPDSQGVLLALGHDGDYGSLVRFGHGGVGVG